MRTKEQLQRILDALYEALGGAKYNDDKEEVASIERTILDIKRDLDSLYWAVTKDRCASCGAQLVPVEDMEDGGYQYDNALGIQVHGGYGMFVESTDFETPPAEYERGQRVFICHECAHKLCEDNPFFNFLCDPYHSHAHTREYHKAHPDHKGWDYEEGGDST